MYWGISKIQFHPKMRSFIVVVLIVCVALVGGAEICRVVHPGSECQETCKAGYTLKAANFPFCYNSYKCCEAPETTTPPTTESPPPPAPKPGCGLEALSVAARILKPQVPVSLNTMECAWPWVVSMQMTAMATNNKPITAHVCNGVLLNKNAFLTIKSCSDLFKIEDVKIRAAVGICNVSNINDGDLEELDEVIDIIEPGLSIVKFKKPLKTDYSLQLLPVCLPEESTEFRTENRACVMASRDAASPFVTSGRVSVVDVAGCDFVSQMLTDKHQPPGTFCTAAKTDKVDACYGDEGGIVMCPDQNNRWILKGVIQSGTCQGGDYLYKIKATNQIIDIEGLSKKIEEQLSTI